MSQHIEEQLIPQEAMLYRILEESELLTRTNCKSSIDRVIKLVYEMLEHVRHVDDGVQLGERFFEICYLELIYDYAKFVQTLPEIGLSDDVPMLERGLARAAAILQWFRPQIQAISKQNPQLGGVQKLVYLIFSSALLYEVGAIEQERVIHLCNAQGYYISRWDPLVGHMDSATHFKIRFRTGWNANLKTPLTHCIAKKLMPTIGLLWLSDSQEALNLWFALLTNMQEAWLQYGLVFSLSEMDILMQEHLQAIQEIDKEVSDDTLLGEIFWDWLKRSIADSDITLNDHGAHAHVLDDGLLLDVDLVFEKFKKYFSTDINKVVLFQQFNYMGLTKLSGQDVKISQYFSEYSVQDENTGSVKNMFGVSSTTVVKRGVIQGLLVDQAHALLSLRQYGVAPNVGGGNQASWLSNFLNRFQQDALETAKKLGVR